MSRDGGGVVEYLFRLVALSRTDGQRQSIVPLARHSAWRVRDVRDSVWQDTRVQELGGCCYHRAGGALGESGRSNEFTPRRLGVLGWEWVRSVLKTPATHSPASRRRLGRYSRAGCPEYVPREVCVRPQIPRTIQSHNLVLPGPYATLIAVGPLTTLTP